MLVFICTTPTYALTLTLTFFTSPVFTA